MNRLLPSARWYAKRGYHVFPCEPRGKRPLVEHGVLEATTDIATIDAWWQRWPDANIGLAAGASRLVVLDVDPQHDGDESLAVLRSQTSAEHLETVTALTGGGGQHLYFRAGNVALAPGQGVLGAGLDIRAGNSYVIAPPSVHASGEKYRWEVGYGPHEREALPFPDAFTQRILDAAKRPGGSGQPVLETFKPGEMHKPLVSLAGSLRRRGLGADEIFAALSVVNQKRCQPPLADRWVRSIADSMAKYAPETPLCSMTVAEGPTEKVVPLIPVAVGQTTLLSWTKPTDERRYSTGIPRLDEVLRYLHPGEMTLLGAWTGIGKSGLSEQIALEVGKTANVLFFPLELGIARTECRMLAKITRTSEDWIERLRAKNYAGSRSELYAAIEELQDRKIEMVSPASGDAFAWGHIRNLIVERRPDVVIIDHLQHIDDWTPSGSKRSDLSAAKITRDLRKLAEEIGVHVLCVHQLKAEKIQRKQRPQIYDFADTAALPRVADTVLALNRPFRGYPRQDNVAELMVLKNRRGPEPWIHTHFVGEHISFMPMTREEEMSALCCPSVKEHNVEHA